MARRVRIQYLSDLHFEFHRDDGGSFVASLDPTSIDALVVAGDLAVGDGVGRALDMICERYAPCPVVYVHGNHEFYGTTRDAVIQITRAAVSRNPNLHWLDCDATKIVGTRFLGAPLWFRRSPEADASKYGLNDFRQIHDFESWVYRENARAISFLVNELREGDVVVTHHLPSQASVAKRWRGHPLNPFFVCDLEELLRARSPSLWVHGHTHDSVDVRVGATRIVCNPFGYVRVEENASFDERAIIEIPA